MTMSQIRGRKIADWPSISWSESILPWCLWAVLIITAVTGYITLAYITWTRYQTNPTVITLELDYYNWNVTYPTVTLCLELTDYEIDSYISKYHKEWSTEDKTELKKFLKVLFTMKSFKAFKYIYDYDKIKKEDYLNILDKLMPRLDADITATFLEAATPVRVLTEMGACYSYNSELAIYNSFDYLKNNSWNLIKSTNIIQINTKILGGLTTTISDFDQAYQVYLHSYNDVIDFASPCRVINEKGILRIMVTISSMKTTPDVIALKPSQRRCQLTHEATLKHSPVYSHNLCRIECRIHMCLKYCKCLPYFYRRVDNEALCDPKGMRCLGKYAGNNTAGWFLYLPTNQSCNQMLFLNYCHSIFEHYEQA